MSDEKTYTACVDHIPTHLLDSTPTFIAHIAKQTAERLTHAIAEKIHDGGEYIVKMTPIHWEQNESICEVSAKRELVMKQLVRCQKCEYYCGEETYTNHRICKVWNEEVFANGFCYEGKPKEQ